MCLYTLVLVLSIPEMYCTLRHTMNKSENLTDAMLIEMCSLYTLMYLLNGNHQFGTSFYAGLERRVSRSVLTKGVLSNPSFGCTLSNSYSYSCFVVTDVQLKFLAYTVLLKLIHFEQIYLRRAMKISLFLEKKSEFESPQNFFQSFSKHDLRSSAGTKKLNSILVKTVA